MHNSRSPNEKENAYKPRKPAFPSTQVSGICQPHESTALTLSQFHTGDLTIPFTFLTTAITYLA